MHYREHPPCDVLRPYIQCYWTLRGSAVEPQPRLVLPDGQMEIIFHLAEPFAQIGSDGVARTQSSALLAGQIWEPLLLRQSCSVDVVAIRFRPGGASGFMLFPQQKVAGEIRNLEEFWGNHACRVRDALGEARSPESRIRLMERLLLEMKPRSPVSLEMLGQRQYRRRFEETVGLPPKLHQRIRRFQRVLSALGRSPIAGIALECGYYDQAHLIRDFKQFAGVTPTAWLRGRKNVLFFQDAVESEALS